MLQLVAQRLRSIATSTLSEALVKFTVRWARSITDPGMQTCFEHAGSMRQGQAGPELPEAHTTCCDAAVAGAMSNRYRDALPALEDAPPCRAEWCDRLCVVHDAGPALRRCSLTGDAAASTRGLQPK